MKSVPYPVVEPVIELGILALQLSKPEKELALKIRKRAVERGYMDSPDGWFVPLVDLLNDLDVVAEFLWHEARHFGEFEIGGGFVIKISPQEQLGIPFDSTFRFAFDLANVVLSLGRSEHKNVAVGAQEFWNISADSVLEYIYIQGGSKGPAVRVAIEPLQKQLRAAKSLVVKFATALEDRLKLYEDWRIASGEFKYMFGLDKIG
ncbi:MAG: hypothetical protein AB1554_01355 [Chloroflexota bacterium]